MESNEPIERAVRQMHEHFTGDVCIEELAAGASMSPFHFLRTFRRFTGVTPALFLSALRLQEAKRLLLTTDRSVTDICFDVGYNSLGTFTTRFTQQVGVSPARLRRLGSGFRLEALALAAERLAANRPVAGSTTLSGFLEAGARPPAILFLGLFEHPIPQQRPLACSILAAPGPFQLNTAGAERGYLFAAGLGFSFDPLDFLLSDRAVDQVAASGCLNLRPHDGPLPPVHLRLRPLTPLDPPLLVALPLLLAERRTRTILQEPVAASREVSRRAGFIQVDTDNDRRPDTFLPGTSANFAAGAGSRPARPGGAPQTKLRQVDQPIGPVDEFGCHISPPTEGHCPEP